MELFALIIGAPPTTDFFFLASQVTFLKSQSQNKAAKGRCLERIPINGTFIALLSNRWTTEMRHLVVVGAAEPATTWRAGNRSRSVRPTLDCPQPYCVHSACWSGDRTRRLLFRCGPFRTWLIWRRCPLLSERRPRHYSVCVWLLLAQKRPPAWKAVVDDQRSICSAIFKASSTSIPRYRTVLSNLV
jgi:hypothetical protein